MSIWYVATTGNDTTGDGSVGNPWLTMQNAGFVEAGVGFGDTIHVAVGTYVENYTGGTNGLRLVKGLIWIADGAVTVKATHSADTGITNNVLYYSGTNVASFNGFTFDGDDGTDDKGQCVYFPAGTTNKTFTDCTFQNSSEDQIRMLTGCEAAFNNCTFTVDNGSRAIYFQGVDLTLENGCTIASTTSNPDSVILCDTNTSIGTIEFDDLTFSHSSTTTDSVILFELGNWNIRIHDSTFTLTSTSLTIPRAFIYCHNSASVEVLRNNFDITSESVTATDAGIVSIRSTTRSHSPKVNYNSIDVRWTEGFTIYVGNNFPTGADNNLDGAEVIGNKVRGRVFFEPTFAGGQSNHAMMIGFCRNATVKYNWVDGCGYGCVTKHNGGANGTWSSGGVFYNAYTRNYIGGIRIKGVVNTKYYGNTIINDNPIDESFTCIFMSDNDATPSSNCTGIDLRNNIFIFDVTTGIAAVYVAEATNTFANIDNNCYWVVGVGTNYGRIVTTTYNTLALWQAAISDEANAQDGDPSIHDSANGDFYIDVGSICQNAGDTTLGAAFDDILINTTVFGVDAASIITTEQGINWDIGAYTILPGTLQLLNAGLTKNPLIGRLLS